MTTKETKELRDILADFDAAMLITRDPDGHPRARPMAIADRSKEGDLWFVTGSESGKMSEIEQDPWVAVTMQSSNTYLSITGRAEIVDDRGQIEKLWSPLMKAWFPRGKDDPRLVVLRFVGERAEYWDNSGVDAIKYAFEAARAVVQGRRPKTDKSQHGEVDLH